jgi:hypothetical protein
MKPVTRPTLEKVALPSVRLSLGTFAIRPCHHLTAPNPASVIKPSVETVKKKEAKPVMIRIASTGMGARLTAVLNPIVKVVSAHRNAGMV